MTDLLEETAAATERRLPRAYLAASYLAHGVTTIGTIVGVVVFLANPDMWPGRVALVVFGTLFVLRVIDPLYEWATTRMTITDREFRISSGLIFKRTRSIRWNAVHTVETTAPWAYRLFGLVRVRIAQGGDGSTQVTLAGITQAFRDELVSHSPVLDIGEDRAQPASAAAPFAENQASEAASVSGRPWADHTRAADSGETLLYRATVADLVVASILFGRFAIIGLAIAFAVFEQLDNFGLLGILASFKGLGIVGLAVVVAIGIIGIGVFASVVRYGRLQVRSTARGGIRVSYGLIETSERVVDPAGITAVVLQRNALEMLLGRVRLGLLTTDTSQQFGSNLLLPSLPRRTVAAILRTGLSDRVPAETMADHRRLPLRSLFAFSAVTALAALAGWFLQGFGLPVGLAILGGLIVWAIIATSARPVVTRLSFDRDRRRASLRLAFIVDREVHLDALAIHLVSSSGLRGRPRYAAVHYYAGEPHQRGSLWFTASDLHDLQSQLGDRAGRVKRLGEVRTEAAARRARCLAAESGHVDDSGFGGTD